MEANTPKKRRFTLGMRAIKTLTAVAILTLAYSLVDRNPCFACIGAVFGMGNVLRDSLRSGGNRFIGTVMGGFIAIPFYWLYQSQALGVPGFVYLTLGMAVILILGQLLGADGGIQPGAVVFFVVLLTVNEDNVVGYAVNRMIDTGIGVALALLMNAVFPSPHEQRRTGVRHWAARGKNSQNEEGER